MLDSVLLKYVDARASIVAASAFESACVKVQGRVQHLMTREEKASLKAFLTGPDDERPAPANAKKPKKDGFAAQALKKACVSAGEDAYDLVGAIPPTSNMAERLFSMARATYGLDRHSMSPMSLEMVLFLRYNRSLWDVNTVHACL